MWVSRLTGVYNIMYLANNCVQVLRIKSYRKRKLKIEYWFLTLLLNIHIEEDRNNDFCFSIFTD